MTAHPALADASARAALRRALLRWYRQEARDLPWRRTHDSYRVWLSEIMLQQTRVATVVPYYERFLAEFPTVAVLAAAPVDKVLRLWAGLGYYRRARHLHAAANVVVRARAGVFPRTADEWRALPGIGPYTAAAISSIVSDEPRAAVDGNIARVIARLFCLGGALKAGDTQRQVRRLAALLLARRTPGTFNQALMELGARVCTPRAPACPACVVSAWCAARAVSRESEVPRRARQAAMRRVRAAALVLRERGRYLLQRRPDGGPLGGMWGWPAVEWTRGAVAGEALERWVTANTGLYVETDRCLGRVRHDFTHLRQILDVFAGRRWGGHLRSKVFRWVAGRDLERYLLATLDRKIWTCTMQAAGAPSPHKKPCTVE